MGTPKIWDIDFCNSDDEKREDAPDGAKTSESTSLCVKSEGVSLE